MTKEEKLQKILGWYSSINTEQTKQLAKQENFRLIREIEVLIGESFPQEIYSFFEKYDGESGNGYGSFFGHSFISLGEMKNSLEFAKTQVKPQNPRVTDPKKANDLIEKIIRLVSRELPLKKKLLFIKPKWYKVEFETGPGTMGGPYFYPSKNTSNQERKIVKLSNKAHDQISQLTEELHKIEVQDYKWDNLEIVMYGDGRYSVDRTFYDFDNTLSLTSTPKGAIKKKYFHTKWIPLLSDFGGNYIGIDLDPDTEGTKGQIIIFGRDEEDMMVLSNSWEEFLDWNLNLISKEGDKLKNESHLHDLYKQLKSV